ncbi:MAG: CehA/McbA family metallohydrolase [Verrucomicrobiota bacterium]
MRPFPLILTLALGPPTATPTLAHDPAPHQATTYAVAPPESPGADSNKLVLTITHDDTLVHARFSLTLEDETKPFIPPSLNKHGIHFTSIQTGKKQTESFLYARGTGPVEIPLPDHVQSGTVTITKGYEFAPEKIPFQIEGQVARVEAKLHRHTNLKEAGWFAADPHLHYERLDPAHDPDWFDMLAADDLEHGVFMIVKGGNVPGIWAQQYAYGPEGTAQNDTQLLIPGEEYRGPFQGHNNLFANAEVFPPIILGKKDHPWHWPTMHEALTKTQNDGGIGGPAHGGTFGSASTAVLDAVLGASEFFELANTHLYELEPWYSLLNCGFILAPVAGTDLPNNPFPDTTQPLFGETRTYLRCGENASFEDWRDTIRRGETFITSGPLIELKVNGTGPGGVVNVAKNPTTGLATVSVSVKEHARPGAKPSQLELVLDGNPIPANDNTDGPILNVELADSAWIALRARGQRKNLLWAKTGILQHQIAHTAPIQIIVDDQPITSPDTAAALIKQLESQREIYATQTKYQDEAHRDHMLALFDKAIAKLSKQIEP